MWSCGFKGRVIFLKQDDDYIYYSALFPENRGVILRADISKTMEKDMNSNSNLDDTLKVITDYLNLKINLSTLYKQWSLSDPIFAKQSANFKGIRILRQEPWENLISFICSSNNNVKRISQMCENLCLHFGQYINSYNGVKYFDFPTPQALSGAAVEQRLRELSFGYRAKYISNTAKTMMSLSSSSLSALQELYNLRNRPYREAHLELLKFTGVGPKVADCVCLMSLDKNDVVPIDTHVLNIVQRDYKKFKKSGTTNTTNSINNKTYIEIGDFFRDIWGEYAGWAHSVLFTADLNNLNNGVNINLSAEEVIKGMRAAKTMKRIKSEDKKVISQSFPVNAGVKLEKKVDYDTVVYGPSGRPLRGKRKLKVLLENNSG